MSEFRWRGGRREFPISVINDGVIAGMVGVALVTQKLIRAELSKKGSGRSARTFVMRKRQGIEKRVRITRTRSAPGEPPAAQTGMLRASWTIAPLPWIGSREGDNGFAVLENRTNKMVLYTLGSRLPYARALEYGSPRTRLAQRPYVRPVLSEVSKVAVSIIAKKIDQRIRKVMR